MKRTHVHSTPKPPSAAPINAGASIASGLLAPPPKCAPIHNPKNEAPQARSGVRSQPMTTSAWASQRGTQFFRTREKRARNESATVYPPPTSTGRMTPPAASLPATASTIAPMTAGAAI